MRNHFKLLSKNSSIAVGYYSSSSKYFLRPFMTRQLALCTILKELMNVEREEQLFNRQV